MNKVSREVLLERTTEAEVFQDMDNFELLNDSSTFALSLRLQFPKFSKGFTSSDFEPFVRSHVGESNLVSLGRLSFPNEWQMQVTNKDVRENLIRLGRTKINTRTCWITPLSQSEVRGYIHWIPTAVSNKKLETLLRSYGEVLLMENQKQNKFTCKVESDARYFGLYLKSGKTMDDVPHFIRVENYHGLITIRGRNPACFHCKEIGHRKSECKMFREKVSDYSMRAAHSAKPRMKARGRRHNPKKDDVGPKAKDQEIQTGEGIVTCPECRKEQLAAEKAAAEARELASAAVGTELASAAEGTVAGASEQASEAGASKLDMKTLASTPYAHVPEFQAAIKKKTRKQKKQEEFDAKVANEMMAKNDDTKPDSSPNDTVAALNAANVAPENAESVELGPFARLEQLKRNIEEILAKTKENLDLEFEASRQLLLAKEAEKSAAPDGKKKRKRRKKKKVVETEAVEIELDPTTVPKDFL